MAIVQRDGFTLVNKKDGKPVEIDSLIESFRGETWYVQGGVPPHKPSSQGKIWASPFGETMMRELYPSVFDCKWIEV